jgi:hypothetical protein
MIGFAGCTLFGVTLFRHAAYEIPVGMLLTKRGINIAL